MNKKYISQNKKTKIPRKKKNQKAANLSGKTAKKREKKERIKKRENHQPPAALPSRKLQQWWIK